MFGGDMQEKLKQMQQSMEESKKRLAAITVDGEAENGKVTVTANGNKEVTRVIISEDLLKDGDKEQVEDLVMLATNRAMRRAEDVYESEMRSAASGFLPGM